ncbi:MAG: condensation domain-containing protein, partial [Blastocatellia bacterium]
IEYLGRVDHQVKIRGFRIELGEIESTLTAHESVLGAVVLARETAAGEKRLVAYIVSNPLHDPKVSELRAYLKGRIPEYMIPAAFVFMDAFPLTGNGKLDRGMLPEPDRERPEIAGAYAEPRSDTEKTLAAAWAEVLGVTQIGIDDNFFELGGDSIRAIQVLSRLKSKGLALSPQEFFQRQTIRELAEQVGKVEQGFQIEADCFVRPFELMSPEDQAAMPPDVEDAFPLTMLQAGMVFHSQYAADSTDYHNVTSFRVRGRLEPEKLREAVRLLMSGHPILRASFDLVHFAEPIQLIHREVAPSFEYEDLTGMDASQQDDALGGWMQIEKHKRFDVTRAPLLRFHVHRLDTGTFQMTMTEHHAILDGWSVASALSELFENYISLRHG